MIQVQNLKKISKRSAFPEGIFPKWVELYKR